MRRAVELERHNPYYRSYLGVVVARAERKWAEAEELCDTAVRMKRNQAQLYLNLAEVYLVAGRREDAVETLNTGLKYARRDIRLNLAINRLSQRREPVFPFLGRKHFLNRQVGQIRHRTLYYLGRNGQ
jgi:Flp pilus assembly protein TadD